MNILPKSTSRKTIALLSFIFSLHIQAQQDNVLRDARLDSLLQIKIEMQKGHLLGENYTIQLHSGALSDGQEIVAAFEHDFPQWPVMVHYETPNYKVWAGNFSVRLSADQALKAIQRKFPTAFIFKPALMRKETSTSENQDPERSDSDNKAPQNKP
ncbi:MAG: SPOR domain-containing protein [Bacteroidetes bacterium]|nr:SPOR domain-containing protein [Bacteroidota bacterium]MDA1209743.1 SPOR domain-containing protein [Bacteroidota bacterium]